MRLSTVFWLAVVFVAVLGLYKVKYKVHEVKSQVAGLESQLALESQAVHVLEAEWSYLTRPERVRELANQHLKLEPITAAQMMQPTSLATLRDVDTIDADTMMPVSGEAVDLDFIIAE